MRFPVSTRVREQNDGLEAALKAIGEHSPPEVLLDLMVGPGNAEAHLATLLRAQVPVLGLRARRKVEGVEVPLALPMTGEWTPIEECLHSAIRILTGLQCPRLLVSVSGGQVAGLGSGVDGQRDLRPGRDLAREGAARRQRESAIERLCRRLHALTRIHPGVRFLLVPSQDPSDDFDLEATGWVLDDLKDRSLGLALDLGALGLRAARGGPPVIAWIDSLERRVDLWLVSDHDGRSRPDLLAGTGQLPWSELRHAFAGKTQKILCGDPTLPAALLPEAVRAALDPSL